MPDDATFAAFDGPAVVMFIAVEIELPSGGQIRLLDGAASVSFGGRVFVGLDPQYGVLTEIDAVSDGVGDEAPGLRIVINPATPDAGAILAAQDMQGRHVLMWIGAVDPATGAVLPDPILVFAGEVDQGVLRIGIGQRQLSLECVSVWERLFEDGEGVRLSNAFHQLAWPGELGLEFVTDVARQLPWGSNIPRPWINSDVLYVRTDATR